MQSGPNAGEHTLTVALDHKWLGILWSGLLNFEAALRQRLVLADKQFQEISQLVAAHAIPLALAVLIFEAEVDAFLS